MRLAAGLWLALLAVAVVVLLGGPVVVDALTTPALAAAPALRGAL